jgi:hypothetical protein
MSSAAGTRDGEHDALRGRSGRLFRAVLSLSRPPAKPQSDAPAAPGLTENLVFEFDEAYTDFVEGFERLPTDAQMLALQAMDTRLSAMVRAKDAALWTEAARRDEPDWQEVRRLAERVLSAFDWPMLEG